MNELFVIIVAAVSVIVLAGIVYIIVKVVGQDTLKETHEVVQEIYKAIGKLDLLLTEEKKIDKTN